MAQTEYQKQWTKDNPDKVLANKARYRAKHPEHWKVYYQEHREDYLRRNREHYQNCDKAKRYNKQRDYVLRKQFGISLAEQAEMLKAQNGLCDICRGKLINQKPTLHVDHNHETGKVRALLCGKCNRTLGMVNENIDILQQMIAYLVLHGN